jgi:hypothetical protein
MRKLSMKSVFSRVLPAIALVVASTTATAGITNDVPSCYLANKIKPFTDIPIQEVFLLIDQTTLFDERLKAQINDNLVRLLRPGEAFTIAEFSAFTQGHYLDVVTRGVVEPLIPEKERDDISERALRSFDACTTGQLSYAQKHSIKVIDDVEAGATNDLAKSDILAALQDISAKIRTSPTNDKILFLASDMLENSSISSFYSHNAVRMLDPGAELKKVADASLFGDFGGARVYVLGAGILTEDAQKTHVYRDPKTMNALKQFWSGYFEKSNAKLIEFGTPALLSPVN